MTVIDAHQHVWDPSRASYDWLDESLAPINRPIGFAEALPSLRRAGVDATVLVESGDVDADTELMLETASAHAEVVGIVAFVPLDQPSRARDRIAELRERSSLIVGVRNLIHTMPDADWLLRTDVNEGLAVLAEAGLSFDLVSVLPRHLEHAVTIAERHPDLRIVIDHLSKPPIGLADHDPWWDLIARAAEIPTVYAKVSGLYSATGDSSAWTPDLIRPFLRRALDVFGPHRLMYGGDWPISMLSGGYDRVWDGLNQLFSELPPDHRRAILGTTAESFYRLDPAALRRAVDERTSL